MAFCTLTKLLILCFGVAAYSTIGTAADGESYPDVEQPAVSLRVKPLGDREYFPPHLMSVIQLANAHLPQTLRLISVIEASREITNHVRYDLILKAIDSSGTEVVCHIVVKEKPWLRSELGEKYRLLEYSNCSSYYSRDDFVNDKTYEPVSYTRNQRNNELSNNNLVDLEAQIFPKTQDDEENVEIRTDNSKELSKDALDILGSLFDIPSSENTRTDEENNMNKKYDRSSENDNNGRIHSESRMKRNVQNVSENEQNVVQKSGRVLLRKRDYNNLKTLLEDYLHKSHPNEEPYRISKAFYIHHENKIDEFQEIMIELTNDEENQISCSVKIYPFEQNETKDVKIDLSCPNLIDVTIHPKTLNGKHQKTKSRKLLGRAPFLFDKYQLKYNKTYNDDERAERYSIFRKNLALIDILNDREQGTAIYGITEFADMTEDEYKQRTGLRTRESNNIKNILADIPDFKLPTDFDWRDRGVISKVKDQGSCGSCWAFSVIGNIEGLHAIKNGNLEEYSEQELLDCDTIDSACNGGLMDDAYKAIEQLGGLELESEYPYKAEKDKCAFNKSLVHATIKGGVDLPQNETAMALWLVANGPISIGINANAMQFYRGGISHPWKFLCRPGGVDHGVLIVGFGVKEYPRFNKTLPYWIVKNSWGDRWGEQGYYRIFRGANACGLATTASSAVLL